MAVQLRALCDVGRLAHATPTAHAVVVLMYFQGASVVAVPAEQHLATQTAVAFRNTRLFKSFFFFWFVYAVVL